MIARHSPAAPINIASVVAACAVLNKASPEYDVFRKQCYWYAGLAFRLLVGDDVMRQLQYNGPQRAGEVANFFSGDGGGHKEGGRCREAGGGGSQEDSRDGARAAEAQGIVPRCQCLPGHTATALPHHLPKNQLSFRVRVRVRVRSTAVVSCCCFAA
ncbi:hypothetical protein DAEQUDRAFT_121124 [Daedalea quercina L-15889]|uniref:Uncharacterized protein n=1 Tax=Daedalea quercina L-15889 TaxID=1314783 RepID=A0A165RWK1_9APHY|nr:hypothetical protein DAEQUDRAFT_121124 [Daedalea quercina L-15889]